MKSSSFELNISLGVDFLVEVAASPGKWSATSVFARGKIDSVLRRK